MDARTCGVRGVLFACLTAVTALAAPPPEPVRFVRQDAAPGGDGLTWKTAFNDLQAGIEDMAADGGGHVWVKHGVYIPQSAPNTINPGTPLARANHFALRDNVEVYGGFAGDEDPATFNLYFRNFDAHETILSADVNGDDADLDGDGFPDDSTTDDNLCNIFWMPYNHRVGGAVLDGFTLTGARNDEGSYMIGGAVVSEGSQTVFRHCVFRWNQATVGGGAVFLGEGADHFEHCRFEANRAFSGTSLGYGGAVYIAYPHFRGLRPRFHACQLVDNRTSGVGGAIACLENSLAIDACEFVDNQAGRAGGAIHLGMQMGGGPENVDLLVVNSTFAGNQAQNGNGGALNLSRQSGTIPEMTSTIWNSTFYNNQTTGDGGGIYVFNGTLNVVNATFVGNLVDSDDDGNGYGGAVHGGAETGQALNCIMWDNRRGNGAYNQLWSNRIDVFHSVVQHGWPGKGNVADDPLLDPLGPANNTGPTRTIALTGVSPALGLGIDTGLPAGVDIAHDQRGIPRNQARGIDAGAYQLDQEVFTVTFRAGANGTLDGGEPERVFQVLQFQSAGPAEAFPEPTHYFEEWVDGAGDHYGIENPMTVWLVENDMTLTAVFSPKWRVRFFTEDIPGASLVGDTEQYIAPWGNGTEVRAVPPPTHTFSHWRRRDTGVWYGDTNPIQVINVEEDFDLEAVFTPYDKIYVARNAVGANDGSSWADAFRDLQDGIDQAAAIVAAAGGGIQIDVWVKAGVYKPTGTPNGNPIIGMPPANAVHFALRNGVAVFGGFAGDEDPATFDLANRDLAADETILSGDLNGDDTQTAEFFPDPASMGDNAYHVFFHPEAAAVDETAILDGFTITGGHVPNVPNAEAGAGMANVRSGPTVRHCVFRHNRHDGDGGGGAVGFRYTDDLPVASAGQFSDCRFEANHSRRSGGAVYLRGYSTYAIDAGFQRCHFIGNQAVVGGGGLFAQGVAFDLRDCLFQTNAAGLNGGAMVAYDAPSLSIDRCTFVGNVGSENGGGCFIFGATTLAIADSTFVNNTASAWYGGGAYIGQSSSVNIWNSTFHGNRASYYGGGLYIWDSGPSALVNLTIASNTVTNAFYTGAGLFSNVSDVSVYNAILWGNRTTSGNHMQLDGDFNLVTHSVIEDGRPSGVAIATGDPLLDPGGPADHGGPTPTIAILGAESSALGHGATSGWPAHIDVADDQRSLPRDQARGIDAGAYQLQSEVFSVTFAAGANGTVDGLPNRVVKVLPGHDAGPVEAQPDAGCHFVRWTRDGVLYSADATLTIFGVTEDMTLVAEFAPNPVVQFITDGTPGATLAGDIVQQVPPGGDTTAVQAVPPATHYFFRWTKDGVLFSDQNPLTVKGVAADMLLVAEFAAKPTVRFVTDGTPGATIDDDASQNVEPGGNCTAVEAVPPVTHYFIRWTHGGKPYSTDNPLTVIGVTESMTLMAEFAPKWRVRFDTFGDLEATLNGNPDQYVEPGGECTPVEAVPSETYYFVRWTKDGGNFSTQNPLTVTGVDADMLLFAEFALKWRVQFVTDGTPGANLAGDTDQYVEPGGNCNPVEAIPPATHYFVRWTDGGAFSSTKNPVTIAGVAGDRVLMAEFAVPSTIFVAAGAAGDGSGRDWANACPDLQEGIDKAAAIAALGGRGVVPVWVKAGIYQPASLPNGVPSGMNAANPRSRHFALRDNVEVYGGFAGDENPDTFDLADRDFTAHETIVCGDLDDNDTVAPDGFLDPANLGDNIEHLFYHPQDRAVGAGAVLDGFTLSGGHSYEDTWRAGAAMFNLSSRPTVRNCRFLHNRSERRGGAVLIWEGGGVFTDCHFESNLSGHNNGGAIHAENSQSELEFERCVMLGNATDGSGGGIFVFRSSKPVTFVDCLFAENTALNGSGGGAWMREIPRADFLRCQFLDNRSQSGSGGGLVVWTCAAASITACEFSGNWAAVDGGGLIANTCTDIDIFSCTFADNTADIGGGTVLLFGTAARLVNTTFHGNQATSQGGGMFLRTPTVSLVNVTLTDNHAGLGGGMRRFSGTVTVANGIAWGNTQGSPAQPDQLNPASMIAVSHSLVQGPPDPSWTDVWNLDPLFDPAGLADNGGPVPTLALQTGSPAVDRGLGLLPDGGAAPNTDARGVRRPQGDGCDLGAYERESGPTTAIRLVNGWNCLAAPTDDWSPAPVLAGLGLHLLGGPWVWQNDRLTAMPGDSLFPAGAAVWLLVGGAPVGGANYDFGALAEFTPSSQTPGTGWRLVGVGGNWPHYLATLGHLPISHQAFVWSAIDQTLKVVSGGSALQPGQTGWLFQTD